MHEYSSPDADIRIRTPFVLHFGPKIAFEWSGIMCKYRESRGIQLLIWKSKGIGRACGKLRARCTDRQAPSMVCSRLYQLFVKAVIDSLFPELKSTFAIPVPKDKIILKACAYTRTQNRGNRLLDIHEDSVKLWTGSRREGVEGQRSKVKSEYYALYPFAPIPLYA
jgi:hypothetical protein